MLRRFVYVSILTFITGCAMPARIPLVGFLYTGVSQGVGATAQLSMKRGEACASSILGLVATGDSSIETARKNGGIRSIASVDEQVTGFLGIYTSVCTVVHGK